jgi:hypothetical protein
MLQSKDKQRDRRAKALSVRPAPHMWAPIQLLRPVVAVELVYLVVVGRQVGVVVAALKVPYFLTNRQRVVPPRLRIRSLSRLRLAMCRGVFRRSRPSPRVQRHLRLLALETSHVARATCA